MLRERPACKLAFGRTHKSSNEKSDQVAHKCADEAAVGQPEHESEREPVDEPERTAVAVAQRKPDGVPDRLAVATAVAGGGRRRATQTAATAADALRRASSVGNVRRGFHAAAAVAPLPEEWRAAARAARTAAAERARVVEEQAHIREHMRRHDSQAIHNRPRWT